METFVDASTIADMLSIKVSTVNYLRRKGEIPFVRIGKHPRFSVEDVLRKLKTREGS